MYRNNNRDTTRLLFEETFKFDVVVWMYTVGDWRAECLWRCGTWYK